MRIGIYGGSFDPPHIGHHVLARDAVEALSLDRLFVVPAGVQPLKADKSDGASAEHRLAMAKAAFAEDESVVVDETEVERSGLSFTVDTVEGFASRYPGAELFLLLGRDSFESLDKWKNPVRIRELCTIALLERGAKPGSTEGAIIATTRKIDVTSSEIRRRRKEGKSIAGFVPDNVLNYIEANNLYASSDALQE